jgi:hypothetical protein
VKGDDVAKKKNDETAPVAGLVELPAGAEAPDAGDLAAEVMRLRGEIGQHKAAIVLLQAGVKPAEVPVASGDGPAVVALGGDHSLPLWEVSLNCPTPLAFKVLRVHAAAPDQAKMEFCRVNGISDSRHDWKINRVEN